KHRVETVLVADDASIPQGGGVGRRGIAGTLFVEKVLGAAAESGMSLMELAALGRRAAARVRTIGTALAERSLDGTDQGWPMIEYGVGIHGEAGWKRLSLDGSLDVVDMICHQLVDDVGQAAAPLLLFVNGLGAAPMSELYRAYGRAYE